jgi:hypothetical protein
VTSHQSGDHGNALCSLTTAISVSLRVKIRRPCIFVQIRASGAGMLLGKRSAEFWLRFAPARGWEAEWVLSWAGEIPRFV